MTQHTFELHLSGDQYGPDLPTVDVTVDGRNIARLPIGARHGIDTADVVTLTTTLPSADAMKIAFANDAYGGPGKDRNAYVEAVKFDGVAVEGATKILTSTGNSLALTLAAPVVAPAPDPAPPAPPPPITVPPQAVGAPRVVLVGPGQALPQLTDLMYAAAQNNGQPLHAIVYPGPAGYYLDDCGTHSDHWTGKPESTYWPTTDGRITCPLLLEAAPGQPAPLFNMDHPDLYFGEGLFLTDLAPGAVYPGETYTHPVTGKTIPLGLIIRGFSFEGFTRGDGYGNWASIRVEPLTAAAAGNSVGMLFQDCTVTGCDNGIMGGAPGQTLIFNRMRFTMNGVGSAGLTHEVYVSGGVDEVIAEDVLSHKTAGTGHLFKSRAARTTIVKSRFISDGGMESACLDVPDGGVLTIRDLVCAKGDGSDASWVIHYSGENQDSGNGVPFHQPSSVDIDGLVMVAPPLLTRHPDWGPVIGFADQSGLGSAASGAGSAQVQVTSKNVSVFGLTQERAGLPDVTILPAAPTLDLTSPIKAP